MSLEIMDFIITPNQKKVIQKRNINVLGWIPQFDGFTKNGITNDEFVITKKPDSIGFPIGDGFNQSH